MAQAQLKADIIITVDEWLPALIYHRICLVLRNKIINGAFVDGDLVPGAEETARSRGVSRITAKRALNELAEDGLAVRERGSIEVSRAEQTVTATLADAEVARRLGVELGAPMLRIGRIVCDQKNQAVEYITGLFRPDRYPYRMNPPRVQTDRANAWSPSG